MERELNRKEEEEEPSEDEKLEEIKEEAMDCAGDK